MIRTKPDPCPLCGAILNWIGTCWQHPHHTAVACRLEKETIIDVDQWNTRPGEHAARAKAKEDERERCIAIVEESRKLNEQMYSELNTTPGPFHRVTREIARIKMEHDVSIKTALEADNE